MGRKSSTNHEVRVACPERIEVVWTIRGDVRGGMTGENVPGAHTHSAP